MSNEEHGLFPSPSREISKAKEELAPEIMDSWRNFSRTVLKEGALSEKTKQLIAVAVAHVTQCPYCIKGHTGQAMRKGASKEEIMEAIWVAAEMRAGAATAHAAIAINEMHAQEQKAQKK